MVAACIEFKLFSKMSRAGRVGVVGYTGITRQIPLSDKPGDSHDLRTNKFSRAGEAVVFGDNAPEFDGSQTTSMYAEFGSD